MPRKSNIAAGQITLEGEIIGVKAAETGTDEKRTRGNMNRISYAEKSAEWLRGQPKAERKRIKLAQEKFRALRDTWAKVYDYEREFSVTYAEAYAAFQEELISTWEQYENISLMGMTE